MKIKLFFIYGVLLIGMGVMLQGCLGNSEDPNAGHTAELAVIDQYIQIHNIQNVLYDGRYDTRYQIHSYGNGLTPVEGDIVVGSYTGKILSPEGTLTDFDYSTVHTKIENLKPNAIPILASVMMEGSTATVFSPSRHGYGEAGDVAKGVPPNSILVYTLEITDVIKPAAWIDRFKTDTTAIKEYLEEVNVQNAIEHPSGIFYTIDEPAQGETPHPYSVVTFDYELRILLGSGPANPIETSTLSNQSVWGLVDGLKIGLPLLQEGTKATFYVPSGLAYGDEDKGAIPKNSILIFKIKLTDVNAP
jgi:FKBP-type peptidyl-prolyl cis-trans isomerase